MLDVIAIRQKARELQAAAGREPRLQRAPDSGRVGNCLRL